MFSPTRFETKRIVYHRARGKFAAFFVIAAAAFLTREISGHALEGPKWLSNPVMRMSLGSAHRTLSDGNTTWNAAAAPALDMWNQVIRRIQLGRVQPSTVQPAQLDGFNSMGFSSTVFGQNFGPNTYAVTTYWYSGTTMAEADVLFNSGKIWDSYRGPSRYPTADIQRVAVHELGHVIGLDHPDEHDQYVDAIMNSNINDRYTLSGDDIAGAQYLYATPSKRVILEENGELLEMRRRYNGPGFVDDIMGFAATQWNIVASADFNGNGSLDIIFQNSSTRQCLVWFMHGSTQVGGAVFATLPPSWEIASAADFNGNSKPDLLLQNMTTGQRVIWFMNGTVHTSSWSLGVVGTMWKITGSGDFNGDGKADILWQNNNTGQRVIWFMNGPNHTGGWDLGTIPMAWNIAGTIDDNSDGKPDILWQNPTTGQGALWYMNGPRLIRNFNLPNIPTGNPTDWHIRNY
jgi:hypothetical protein